MRKLLPLALAAFVFASLPLYAAEGPGIDALIRDLKSSAADKRAHAAEVLGRLGPQAAAAVPALVAELADKNAEVQYEALPFPTWWRS
jgi:HEAT repeat protein